MWVLIVIAMYGSGMDASKDVFIQPSVDAFETEEQCHNGLRTLHQKLDDSSLKWDKMNPPQLYLLAKNKYVMWKCYPATIKAP